MINNLKSLIVTAIATVVLGTASFHATAQTIVSATGPLAYFEVSIQSIATRPAGANGVYSMQVVTDAGVNVNCLSNFNSAARFWPLIASDRADFKFVKDTIQLAYALKQKIRIYSNSCANYSLTDSALQYPIIWGVDTISNP